MWNGVEVWTGVETERERGHVVRRGRRVSTHTHTPPSHPSHLEGTLWKGVVGRGLASPDGLGEIQEVRPRIVTGSADVVELQVVPDVRVGPRVEDGCPLHSEL